MAAIDSGHAGVRQQQGKKVDNSLTTDPTGSKQPHHTTEPLSRPLSHPLSQHQSHPVLIEKKSKQKLIFHFFIND